MQNDALTAAVPRPATPPPGPAAGGLPGPLSIGDAVVHPAHGVGQFAGIDADEFDGTRLEFLRLFFADRRMTLRVPVGKAERNGLRRPMAPATLASVMDVLAGTPRSGRGIWARRAIDIAAKLNSGDPIAIAEVLRDLGRNVGRSDQPSGERQAFDQALDRLAGEIAALDGIPRAEAAARILVRLQRPRAAS